MPQNPSSKSSASGQPSPSSSDKDIILGIFGGSVVEDKSKVGKRSHPKESASFSWADYVPYHLACKSPDQMTGGDLLKFISSAVSGRLKIEVDCGKRHAYNILTDLRHLLIQRFPETNEYVLAIEYLDWYVKNMLDSHVARYSKWYIKLLLRPDCVAKFCDEKKKGMVARVSEDQVRLPTDRETLVRRVSQSLESFVQDYGPVLPFALLRKKFDLLENEATSRVIRAVRNIVIGMRSSYPELERKMVLYGPYPNSIEAMGARVFLDSLSQATMYEFSQKVEFLSSDDQI